YLKLEQVFNRQELKQIHYKEKLRQVNCEKKLGQVHYREKPKQIYCKKKFIVEKLDKFIVKKNQ
ncbi:6565_t:CDS:1, partial [Racocetra persica]